MLATLGDLGDLVPRNRRWCFQSWSPCVKLVIKSLTLSHCNLERQNWNAHKVYFRLLGFLRMLVIILWRGQNVSIIKDATQEIIPKVYDRELVWRPCTDYVRTDGGGRLRKSDLSLKSLILKIIFSTLLSLAQHLWIFSVSHFILFVMKTFWYIF